ncbi:DUF899 family protein [Thermasporomyces composti]|jgi:predicted dithiol-disulfide oxidoreductase (DUF899 family)|uniref:Putative dithiol-disulfide oxidoreductase (DUF899 family) n=1 Tax=Thermasporomyces composti TaxID=696763 RepID=A0A3D9V374_THECX|nr:DUF899 family protein [Thermasporomyces composti]REF34670.1 putative dithiol-disulfide oxidoreductase (DUF899 family) [Thermasporomyces composti]
MREPDPARESAEYRDAREELRRAEVELMLHRERVAELRRRLPPGPRVEDYVFEEGPTDLSAGDEPVTTVRLSELFTGPGRDLVIYHLMDGTWQTEPCPTCTMWVDGINGVAPHLAQTVDVAIVATADLPVLRAQARRRNWTNVRLLSARRSTFKRDLGSEDADGIQDSAVSVFYRDDDGLVRHFYTVHPQISGGVEGRGTDLLSLVWQILDLTRGGRGH